MKLSERLDILAKIMKDVGQGQTAMAATVQEAAKLVRRVENAAASEQVEAGGCAPPVIAGPLNEPFGNPEEFPLNEVSGDSGQLASLEQRARELLKAQYLRSGMADATAETLTAHVERTQPEALRAITAALSAQPRGVVEYVECRQCDHCGHAGINDASDTQGACHQCDWTGADPAADKCPGCGRTDCMGAACPKCGALYQLVADKQFSAPQPREVRAIPSQEQLIEWAVGWRASDSREGLTGEADMIERITYAIRAGLLATTPQDAAGVVARRACAEVHVEAAFPYKLTIKPLNLTPKDGLFQPGSVPPLYTTPPPGVDVGKLRELVTSWRTRAGKAEEDSLWADSIGFPDASRMADKRSKVMANLADELAALIDAAGVGVGNA